MYPIRFTLPWVTATTFGAAGFGLAILMAMALVGWHWVFLPAVLVSALAVYGTSTGLGVLATRWAGSFPKNVLLGVGVALATLLAGVVALGLANTFLTWLDEVTSADLGLGPYFSLPDALHDYVVKPTIAMLYVGSWIAAVAGGVYGAVLERDLDADP